MPSDSTYTSIQDLVWGGQVEAIYYTQGNTWAWVLFRSPDDCKTYAIDAEKGIKLDSGEYAHVTMATNGDPMSEAMQAHYDRGATRCLYVFDYPAKFNMEMLCGAKGRTIESFEEAYSSHAKVPPSLDENSSFDRQKLTCSIVQQRLASIRFSNVKDAIRFKEELAANKESAGLQVIFARDPCQTNEARV